MDIDKARRGKTKVKYVVVCITREKQKEEKTFKTCREAFCYATNYNRVKISEVFKGNQLIKKFKY